MWFVFSSFCNQHFPFKTSVLSVYTQYEVFEKATNVSMCLYDCIIAHEKKMLLTDVANK